MASRTELMDRVKECVCRRARLSDHAAVMDIGDVFNGVDYLQHYFYKYMSDPNYYCFVCEVDERVVRIHDMAIELFFWY